MSKLCKAIRRSGHKKGSVCNNKIVNGQTFCSGHMSRLKKAAVEGERDERHLQGEGCFDEEDVLRSRLSDGFMQLNPWD